MTSNLSSVLDRHFGIHAHALEYRSARSRVLASNLTNADTPNFKARDIRFEDVLQANGLARGKSGVAGVQMAATHSGHIRTGAGASVDGARLMYRNPYQPTLDGNTVEAEVEQGKFAENAVQYQASLMFLSGKIRGLRDAIKGGA